MSKIGKQAIKIPAGVKVEATADQVTISGPKGSLNLKIPFPLEVKTAGQDLQVLVKKKTPTAKELHGLIRSLLANMIAGVNEVFKKTLELHGVGYRAALDGKSLKLSLGFSHPIIVNPLDGIQFEVEESKIIVSGCDKQLVGQQAAQIRAEKPPEPYKGKGIHYLGEVIRRKPGKAAKAETAGG